MDRTDNIEALARDICTRQMPGHWSDAEISDWVDRGYWKVTAALIEAGLIDERGQEVPHSYLDAEAAWFDWLARHPAREPHIRR